MMTLRNQMISALFSERPSLVVTLITPVGGVLLLELLTLSVNLGVLWMDLLWSSGVMRM
ncbi:hypothetical protein CIPAW_11G161900 [Carya illinoinensis]|uniref:Uncharacterized protein n=1 Tax=Carya illinoinensis TaxID=32201 RepID=A0A8T1P5U8_CARIL|nr:hypothetical protein CIPAW_11G161900 [Carya illinoinensis]